MFSTPRVNVIASSAGFSVEVLGRTGLEYREGDKVMFVDSEVLSVGIAVFTSTISKWNPPFDKEPITKHKKQEISENIRAAFLSRNETVNIH